MRVCELHRERATETLVSRKTGIEYDLCPACEAMLAEMLNGEDVKLEKRRGRNRTAKTAEKTAG
jgi:Zn-finger nucleic acid-binding protein